MQNDSCVLCGDLATRDGRLDLGDGLALAADAAPLAPGHLLLHIRQHLPSFAAVDAKILRRARAVVALVEAEQRLADRGLLVFEHGTNGDAPESGCVDHAHIHMMPFDRSRIAVGGIEANLPLNLVEPMGSIAFGDLHRLVGTSYFWIADGTGDPILFRPHSTERQIMRRVVARMTGLERHRTWDLYDIEAAKAATARLHDIRFILQGAAG